jgi:hypothetical protein
MNTRKILCGLALVLATVILGTSKYLSRKMLNNYKRSTNLNVQMSPYYLQSNHSNNTECRNRTIDEFPPDFLSLEQKRHGGVIIHIFIMVYLFCAVAIVCDEYFVHSLNRISNGKFCKNYYFIFLTPINYNFYYNIFIYPNESHYSIFV